MEAFKHTDYRSILKSEYLKKNFSLRRFAQHLDVQPSFLSEVMANKKNLSDSMALKISMKLQFAQAEQEYFLNLVQLEKSKDPHVRENIINRIDEIVNSAKLKSGSKFHDLSVDQFRIISDWQHMAILKLLDRSERGTTTAEVAEDLGLHAYDVELSLLRLQRLDLVDLVSGKWRKNKHDINIVSNVPNQALRNYHQQMLNKTLEAQETQLPTVRYTGTENILLDEKQRLLADDIFEEAFQKILKMSQESKGNKKAELFHCGIHMIKLTKDKK